MYIMTKDGWKRIGVMEKTKRTVYRKSVLYHNKWWSFPFSPESYDDLFIDAVGDRRNGDGTLRPHVSHFSI